MNKKIAYIGAAPAYYFIPFLQELTKEEGVELDVYWGSQETTNIFESKQYGVRVDETEGLLDGYKYKFLKNVYGKESFQNGFFGLNSFDFYRDFKNKKYDFIIVHGWQYLNNINAIVAAKLSGTKVLLRAETPLNQELRKSRGKLFLRKIILKGLFKLVSGFLYISTENKKFYKYYGIQEYKLFLTPYSVNNNKFQDYALKNKGNKSLVRKSIGVEEDDVVIIFVGKLFHKKRPLTLLRAFNKIKQGNKKLLFIGSGEDEEKLKQYVTDNNMNNVIFSGYQTQNELPKFLNIADIFVLPSGDGETWGLVNNEAMNFQLPIVVSDIVGSHFDVATKNNGFVFKLDDINELTRYLEKLVGDKRLREEFGSESLKIVNEFSSLNVKNGIMKAIQELC
jgi:glycosyltransferase involved in cell wall biosynthesis